MRTHFLIAILATALAACSTTSVVNSWKDPNYTGGPVRSLLVVGVSSQASVRRIFEETFSESLKAQGVAAVPSYTLVPADGQIPEDKLKEAIAKSGAEGVLITRMVGKQTDISTMPVMAPPAVGMRRSYYGYYSNAWVGYYEPMSVQTYSYVIAETTLFRVDGTEPVWSGTTETLEPTDVRKSTQGFAEQMIKTLKKEGVI